MMSYPRLLFWSLFFEQKMGSQGRRSKTLQKRKLFKTVIFDNAQIQYLQLIIIQTKMQQSQQYYPPVHQPYQNRIFIYEANTLIGHRLVQYFRNDHVIEVNPNILYGTMKQGVQIDRDLELDMTVDVQNNPLVNSVIAGSDVIVFTLNQGNSQQLEYLLKFLKCLACEKKKKVIVISSMFTWKSKGKSNLIKKDDYYTRRIIDSACKELQNMTLGINHLNNKICGSVISCGVVYGMGQEVLFGHFKQALEQKEPLNIYGRGTNYIPTIHVDDLAQFAFDLAFSDVDGFHLATDQSNVTQRELIETIAKTLGNGKVNEKAIEDGLLDDCFDIFAADVMVDPSSLPKISAWKRRGGLVANMGAVVGEFNTSRGLKPNKIVIHGVPVSGKSQLACILAKNYGLPVLTISSIVEEVKSEDNQFATEIKGILEEMKAVKIEEERKIYEEAKKKKKGKGVEDFNPDKVVPRLEDKDVARVLKRRLNMADCLNKGYIIDGILKTHALSQAVFQDENGQLIQATMPNSIFNIDATEEEVKERIKKMSAESTGGTHWNEEQTVRRFGIFKQNNEGKKWIEFFEGKTDIKNVTFQYADPNQFIQFVERNGPLGFKARPAEEEQKSAEEVKAGQEGKEAEEKEADKAEGSEPEEEEEQQEEAFDLEKLTENETKILNEKSRPIRQYLIDNVIPQITEGLLQICKETPPDPINYLIHFLQVKKSKKSKRKF